MKNRISSLFLVCTMLLLICSSLSGCSSESNELLKTAKTQYETDVYQALSTLNTLLENYPDSKAAEEGKPLAKKIIWDTIKNGIILASEATTYGQDYLDEKISEMYAHMFSGTSSNYNFEIDASDSRVVQMIQASQELIQLQTSLNGSKLSDTVLMEIDISCLDAMKSFDTVVNYVSKYYSSSMSLHILFSNSLFGTPTSEKERFDLALSTLKSLTPSLS